MAHSESLAARHAEISERFTTLVRGAGQWMPSPVPEWNAADVVDHLTTWFPSSSRRVDRATGTNDGPADLLGEPGAGGPSIPTT